MRFLHTSCKDDIKWCGWWWFRIPHSGDGESGPSVPHPRFDWTDAAFEFSFK